MSFNTFGKIFRFTTWGESHGPAIGCIIDGSPPNIDINEKEIQNLTNDLKLKKEKTHPTRIKTSGSTFKNPILQTKKKVWELIKESVPLDKCFGDACISEKHCNFFVNKGNATFKDMSNLINFVS